MYNVLEHFEKELNYLISQQTDPFSIVFSYRIMEKNILRKKMQ